MQDYYADEVKLRSSWEHFQWGIWSGPGVKNPPEQIEGVPALRVSLDIQSSWHWSLHRCAEHDRCMSV
jgi:hypothetical protein